MYLVKDYMSNETVAVCSRKEDALAMIQQRISSKEPILIVEEV
jgi:uncharacterized protein YcbK (DUF882 family)